MANHKVEMSSILNSSYIKEIVGAFGNGQDKAIHLVSAINCLGFVSSFFEVLNKREVILKTEYIQQAIDKYNSI